MIAVSMLRQRTGSTVCPGCGSLVGVNDETCYNCGRRNPALWGFSPLLRRLGQDLGFGPFVIVASVGLYLATLAASDHPFGGGSLFSLFSPDITALFLGNRNNEERNFAAHYAGAEHRIVFGGYQTDIPQLLAGCYAGCIPSTGWDSFPMSSIEMQACGLPVIVSDWQGVPETVANGVTGIVTPTGNAYALADAIIALADDPARRQRMSDAALARVAGGFTREHQIRNLVDCLAKRG